MFATGFKKKVKKRVRTKPDCYPQKMKFSAAIGSKPHKRMYITSRPLTVDKLHRTFE
jgi:hypothetical protein